MNLSSLTLTLTLESPERAENRNSNSIQRRHLWYLQGYPQKRACHSSTAQRERLYQDELEAPRIKYADCGD